jgi:hypothetical protein
MQSRDFLSTVILVTGSRQVRWNRSKLLFDVLSKQPMALYVEGGAEGIDSACRTWCFERALPIVHWQADWHHAGRSAGPQRNQEMVDFLVRMRNAGSNVYCLAFPAKGSVGTWDCVDRCRKANIRGRVIPLEEEAT